MAKLKPTRAEAILAQQEQYDTKKPCRNGHYSPRNTISGECLQCRKGWSQKQALMVKQLRKQFKQTAV